MTQTQTATDFLTAELRTVVGQPLRVAVYSRIADGIRGQVFKPGALLPKEAELGEALGVSRTVVREALMLLQEDGLIITRRGIGRFVADSLPYVGLEELRPLDAVLSEPENPVKLGVREFTLQPTTDFVSGGLALDSTANAWFREAVIYRSGEPIAILQEHVPAGRHLEKISSDLASNLDAAAERNTSLLTALIDLCGPVFTDGVCQISTNVVGTERGNILSLSRTEPVLILTQTAKTAGQPVYLAKAIITQRVGPLTVVQASP